MRPSHKSERKNASYDKQKNTNEKERMSERAEGKTGEKKRIYVFQMN